MKLPYLTFAIAVILATGGCSNPLESPNATNVPIAQAPLSPTTPPSSSLSQVDRGQSTGHVRKVRKTPEVECDELIAKLKDAEFWSPSGMNDNGRQCMVQDVYVGDRGVLQVGMCDWFWEVDKSQMQEWLQKIQGIWASVHSPNEPSKSSLSCWIPDMKNENGIPKVDCSGVSDARAQKLWDETRGKVSKRTLDRYSKEQFSEMRNRTGR
jgi:hypothetical protein